MNLLQRIFSVKNVGTHKVFTVLGLKFKFRNKQKQLLTLFDNLNKKNNEQNKQFVTELNSIKKQVTVESEKIFKTLELLKKVDIKRKVVWNTPGIWNFMGGNFKDYIIKNNMTEKLQLLKKNLDEKSCKVVDILYRRLIVFPDLDDYECFIGDFANVQKRFQYDEEISMKKNYNAEKPRYAEKYKFSTDYGFNGDVFYYHHGLRFANKAIHKYIKGKDFIDGGAFIGDSALIMHEYLPRKVVSFELAKDCCENYIENMKLNNIPKDKYILIEKGLYKKEGKTNITIQQDYVQRSSLSSCGETEVLLTDIDTVTDNLGLNVGFIKLDVEGAELDALEGMKKTILKYSPVLSVAIYHNPQEFFELKPRLEEITKDLNYVFTIRKLEGNVYHPLVETVVFAYPKNIIKENI